MAKEEISLKAPVININAKEELNLIKGDALSGTVESSITRSAEIDKKAKVKTKAIGTDKEEYPQIEDTPPEEEFDGWKLFGNVVAGLAVVVAAVTVVAAATVATGGAALAAGVITAATAYTGVIAGSLLGGITLLY